MFIALALPPIIQVLLHPVLLHFTIALVGSVVGLSTTSLKLILEEFLNNFPSQAKDSPFIPVLEIIYFLHHEIL